MSSFVHLFKMKLATLTAGEMPTTEDADMTATLGYMLHPILHRVGGRHERVLSEADEATTHNILLDTDNLECTVGKGSLCHSTSSAQQAT